MVYRTGSASLGAVAAAVAEAIGHGTNTKFDRRRLALMGPAAVLSIGIGVAATAQEAGVEEVVVTGSRIQRQDFTANSPIVTVDADTFENTSTIGIETVLNQLPQFVPAATQFTSSTLQATATTTPGASVVNLRGLGSFRTLTLIDGRRAQPLNASLAVDTNSIPSAAVARVEIISGGASAVYGADAVAGVVNFILKDNYEGMDFSARWGPTAEGDGEELQVSALIGADFADGRGNVMLGVEHANRSPAYDINRKWLRERLPSSMVTGTEGTVAETYIDFGIVPPSQRPSQAAIDAIFNALPECTFPNGTGTPCLTPDTNDKYFINRTPDGSGSIFTGAAAFGGTNGHAGSYRYNGPLTDPATALPYRKITADGALHENNLSALTTVPLERYSLFAKAEYQFAENVSAYLRGNLAYTDTKTATLYSPAVNNWTGTIPVGFEGSLWPDSLNADGTTNPAYLPGGAYGLNCPPVGGCTESQAFPLPPELEALLRSRQEPDADVRIHRVLDFLPERQTENRNTVFQITAGLEGALPNEMRWDASVTHGVSEAVTIYDGFGNLAQYNAVIGSPNFGVSFQQLGISPTSSGRGSCTTGLPLVRDFAPSQDCIDTITIDMQATGRMVQTVAEVNLTGDVVELPAGTMQFALGAGYRDYDYQYINDHLNSSTTFISQVIGLFAQGNTYGELDVSEVYGELLVPLVRDKRFIQELSLELGGRYSDYSTSGGVDTYKILGDWVVNPYMRLRGGYNRATRAPHIAEYFLGRAQTTVSLAGDPCSQNDQSLDYSANPTNPSAAQVEALCRQLMTPTASRVFYDTSPVNTQPGGSVVTTAFRRGNPLIEPETADTFTLGLVLESPFQRPWLSGLSATIDYYSIEIDDIIALQSGDETWRQCVVSNDPNSEQCSLTFRDPFDGRLTLVDLTYTNRGNIKFTGYDLQLNWQAQFADLGFNRLPGGVAVNMLATVPKDRRTQDGPAAPVRDWVGTSGCDLGVSCSGYDYQVFTTFNWFNGPLSLSLRWNHFPTIESSIYATDPDTRQRGVFETYDVFSLAASYRLADRYTFRGGIENLFDTNPPLSGGAYAADGGLVNQQNPPNLPSPASHSGDARYDQLGRRFFVGVDVSF